MKTKVQVPNKEFQTAFNKCINEGIRIYPVPTSNGTFKKKARVKIVVDYGLKKVESDYDYSQEDEMTYKIIELYKHIAERL